MEYDPIMSEHNQYSQQPDCEGIWILGYPEELEIKNSTDSQKFANYLVLRLEVDGNQKLSTSLFDKRDDLNFP